MPVTHARRFVRRLLRGDGRRGEHDDRKKRRFHGAMIQNWRRQKYHYISV
jgi:hypothetical protein